MRGGRPVSQRLASGRDPWQALREHTAARIALGRSGASLPTRELLAFGLAHAQARDAVLTPLEVPGLCAQLGAEGWEVRVLRSRAPDRSAYLARPDWGRRLDPASLLALQEEASQPHKRPDLVVVISDGLSSTAVQHHALPLLSRLRVLLANRLWAPLTIATQARVALADEVGAALHARVAISLIGERPGLSSPDSLGAYITHAPRVGLTDEARNCVSNIRPEGLDLDLAAVRIAALVEASLLSGLSGVGLRPENPAAIEGPAGQR